MSQHSRFRHRREGGDLLVPVGRQLGVGVASRLVSDVNIAGVQSNRLAQVGEHRRIWLDRRRGRDIIDGFREPIARVTLEPIHSRRDKR